MVPVAKPRCTICARSDKRSINHALREPGSTVKAVSERFGLPYAALHRHNKNHLKAAPEVKAADAAIVAEETGDLFAQLDRYTAQMETMFNRSIAKGRAADVAKIANAMRGYFEFVAKMRGQLKEGPTINIFNAPSWVVVQTSIIAALAPFPEAKAAVVRALGTAAHD